MRRTTPLATLLLFALISACAGRGPGAAIALDVATTTSVQNSGLLDVLLPRYAHADIRIHPVGSGLSLKMLETRQVSAVIAHAPLAEAGYLARHPDWSYRKIAFNRFTVVGPAGDPARVADAPDVLTAFQRIAASRAFFVSRGDQSGTHERELSIWKSAGVTMPPDRVITSGSSMAVALRHADEKQAYTISDEATFWQLQQKLSLVQLRTADPELLNTYAVIHAAGDEAASAFASWLSTGEGRELIGGYQIRGRQAFTLWPRDCPNESPSAQPCG
jgi:tungstate transport system substrate-binding protein